MDYFDLHCDTLYECYETGQHLRENRLAVDRAKAAGYGRWTQVFALFCGAEPPEEERAGRARSLLDLPAEARLPALLETARAEFAENADWLALCRNAEEIADAHRAGKAAALLSVEGAELFPGAWAVELAYDAGVRLVTLAWNNENAYACGAAADNDKGLTEAGRALAQDLIRRGVILDVSHLSDAGFWELCALTEAPLAATHSNSRAVCRHPRNLTDLQFAELVRRGGLVGLNLYTEFVSEKEPCTADDVLRHIERFLALGGETALALGCDLDGCSKLPAGIETVADVAGLAEAMLRRNYLQSTVDALFFGNAAAFMTRML